MRYQRSSVKGHHLLKFLVKKRQNSKTIAFRVIPLALEPHLVMISKYSKYGVDNLIPLTLFDKWDTLVFAQQQQQQQQL